MTTANLREAALTVYELTRLFFCGHRSVKQERR